MKHILEREEIWNKWKNEGCPNYVKEKRPPPGPSARSKRIKPVTSDFMNKGDKPFLADNSVMSKLCNVNHDNLEACKDPDRQFLPTLKEFFEEAIDQLDPENQVEKEYQLVYQTDWAWKSLRLLAKRSSLYFMQNQNVKTIAEYLEAICNKLGKEFAAEQQQLQQQSLKESDLIKQEDSDSVKNVKIENDDNENSQHANSEYDDMNLTEDQTANNPSVANTNLNPDANMSQEQMDDDANNTFNDADKEIKDNDVSTIKEESNNLKRDLDCDLISFVSEFIESVDTLKNLAVKLSFNQESLIDGDVKLATRSLLQAWTVF
jgi:hypothetical protein